MQLLLERKTRTGITTIGRLSINGKFECYILEDTDRGLHSGMKPAQIAAIKVKGATCIPTGTYPVLKVYWPRRNDYYLQLQNVPGYSGIFIHTGNTEADTQGCLLPGQTTAADFIGNSKKALEALEKKVFAALSNKEEVFITIQ